MIARTLKIGLAGLLTLGTLAGAAGLVSLRLHHGRLLSVQTKSMVPVINKGDLVVVNRVPDSQLAVGDVITFVNPANKTETITHRIIKLPSTETQGLVVTKGDANPTADTPISTANIVGKSTAQVPKVGFLFDFLRQPLGLILLIYIPALSVIIHELKKLAKYYESQKPYQAIGYNPKHDAPSLRTRTFNGAKLAAIITVITALIAVPVHAQLSAKATLTGNSISSIPIIPGPQNADNILLRQLVLRCSSDNGATQAKRPRIVLFNPTKRDIQMGNWYIEDNNSRFITLPSTTVLKAGKMYVIAPYLFGGPRQGLDYAGDHVKLYSAPGALVDGVSWGSDNSILSPSLSSAEAGTRYQRVPPRKDNNLATDFNTFTRNCPTNSNEINDGTPQPTVPGQYTIVEQTPATDSE